MQNFTNNEIKMIRSLKGNTKIKNGRTIAHNDLDKSDVLVDWTERGEILYSLEKKGIVHVWNAGFDKFVMITDSGREAFALV